MDNYILTDFLTPVSVNCLFLVSFLAVIFIDAILIRSFWLFSNSLHSKQFENLLVIGINLCQNTYMSHECCSIVGAFW